MTISLKGSGPTSDSLVLASILVKPLLTGVDWILKPWLRRGPSLDKGGVWRRTASNGTGTSGYSHAHLFMAKTVAQTCPSALCSGSCASSCVYPITAEAAPVYICSCKSSRSNFLCPPTHNHHGRLCGHDLCS